MKKRLPAAASRANHGALPEVAVFGEWDTANLGDRAIRREVEHFFSSCGWRVSAYGLGSLMPVADESNSPEFVARADPGARAALRRMIPGTARALRALRQRYRMLRLLPRMSRAQAIVVGGGALLSDAGLHFPQSLSVLADCARLLGKTMVCLGCSAEGAWSGDGERKISGFLGACTGIAARDAATAERVAAVLRRPCVAFGDFCLSEAHLRPDVRGNFRRRGIGVNVSLIPGRSRAEQAHYEDAVAAVAAGYARARTGDEPPAIRIFTTGLPADEIPAQRIFERLAGYRVELHCPRSLAQLAEVLQACSLVVASRLHGAILALAEGTPVVGFSPVPKLKNYFSTMGIGHYSFGLDDAAYLAQWVGGTGHASVLEEQRDCLRQAPVWRAREAVRAAFEGMAA
ncbi:MAG: polysaccharide pyruvyl transferase family protein, partial [Burkholderiales bacterium]|nr:polysaccharide pyruvyl transferase family protein [Burkholderiales bacterium]